LKVKSDQRCASIIALTLPRLNALPSAAWASELVSLQGGKVVGVSDRSGAIVNEKGLDIMALRRHMRASPPFGGHLTSFPGGGFPFLAYMSQLDTWVFTTLALRVFTISTSFDELPTSPQCACHYPVLQCNQRIDSNVLTGLVCQSPSSLCTNWRMQYCVGTGFSGVQTS